MKPKHVQVVAFILILAVAAVMGLLRRGGDTDPSPVDLPPSASPPTAAPEARTAPHDQPAPTVTRPAIGFRSRAQLLDHFDKHGREFKAKTAEEYLQLAQSLRDVPKGGAVLEVVRETDGVVTRFDRKTGAFLAFNRDGTIRTFFRPDDGEAYFRRQIDRAEDRP